MQTLLLLALVVADPPSKPFDPVGIWEGTLDAGVVKLRLAFTITKAADGSLTATMDSVDQGAKGIPIKEAKFADGRLTFDLPKQGAKYAGIPNAAGDSVEGTWSQSGHEFALGLKRVAKATEPSRPQTPAKPYPYVEEEVTIDNAAAGVKLAGTLTRPKGGGPFPAVVLVSGSGPQDRDESLFGHKPFLVLADHLTRKGIAVLRYDDRGVGKSTGKSSDATTADFGTDAYAAVTFLRARKEIDLKRVGIAGHSEGGVIAPMVAAQHPDEVGFIVMLAGTGLPGDEVLRTQLAALLRARGIDDAGIDLRRRRQQIILSIVKAGGDAAKVNEAVGKFFDDLSEEDRQQFADAERKVGEAEYRTVATPWMRYFLGHDPRPTLRKVRCPVLALNGEHDLQVTPKDNLPAVAAALKEGGNTRATAREMPGLNHLFQHCKTGGVEEYGQSEETFSPEALATIADWILALK